MTKSEQKQLIIGIAAIVIVASGILAGFKIFIAEPEEVVMEEPVEETKVVTVEQTEAETVETDEISAEEREFLRALDEAIAQEPVEEKPVVEEVKAENNEEVVNNEGFGSFRGGFNFNPQQWQTGGNVPQWQAIWQDFQLTEEENGRFQQGLMLAFQKYWAMSPEEQAAERLRLRNMRTQFEAMSEEERNGASQRMRDRMEDWRVSGAVELPELTLD